MLKVKKFQEGGRSVLAISGRIEDVNLGDFEALYANEPKDVILDLEEVSLAGRSAVSFLAHCESKGATLRNCPGYVREWIDRERGSQ